MIKLVICGVGGRMGSRILDLARRDSEFKIVYGLEAPGYKGEPEGLRAGSDASEIKNADVVIDFTVSAASAQLVPVVAKYKKAYVIGTTGFDEFQLRDIEQAAHSIPIVKSPNMSLGVNVFFQLAQETARALPSYDVEIVEAHHKQKKDAPSGTALHAGGLIEKITGKSVRYQSIREGDIVGDHRVVFKGPSESIELSHHAESRDSFAAGALAAAKWVIRQDPGLYSMKDVLGL